MALRTDSAPRTALGTLALVLLPLAASAALIQVDSRSQGRTFLVDTDRPEIRKALREVTAAPRAGSLPEWLAPYPSAVAVARPSPHDPPDFAHASYRTAAAPDEVFAYYESALRVAGVTITYINRQPGRGGAIHAEDKTSTAVVSVSPGTGPTDITVNWRPKMIKPALPASARLEAVWYDDEPGILRVRDAATGKEYELDGAAILNYAKSEPLQSAARANFPAWLATYPGAKVDVATGPPPDWQPQKFIDMRSYNIELETHDSVAQVAAFYRDIMARNGLTIENESQSEDWSYSLQARSGDRMHLVYLNVLKRSKETFIRLMDHYTLPRR